MNFTSVTVDTKTAVERGNLNNLKSGDVQQRTIGMDEATAQRETSRAFDNAKKALDVHERVIPAEIKSHGHGPNQHSAPYFAGQLERAMLDKSAERIARFGKDGVVVAGALANMEDPSVIQNLKTEAALKAARAAGLASGAVPTHPDEDRSATKVAAARTAEATR